MPTRNAAMVAALLLLLAPPAAAQGSPSSASPAASGRAGDPAAPVLGAVRIEGAPPVIDGRLDDAAWAAAPAAHGFVQRAPNAGAGATQPTEVRVLYTSSALYIGARLGDRPDSIAAQLARRDASGIYSDWFFVMLDSDRDRQSAYAVGVNPREVQRDFTVAEDGSTDSKWDAVWEVRTAVDSAGWTAEFRIPLSQLRFSPGGAPWGLNFERIIARNEEDDYWSPIPPNAPGFVSRFGTLAGLSGLSSPTRLELRPYAVSRLTRAPGDVADPFYSRNSPSASAGLDARYSVTSNLTLTATVNPDFGQVEADPSQVNLTAFETSFAEQRPFFVEDAQIFKFNMGGSAGQLLYTRRIGAPPHGRLPGTATFDDVPSQSTILGAVKLSGRTPGGWTIGVLDAVTADEDARFTTAAGGGTTRASVEPLTNFSAARLIRDFRGGASALGGILTVVNRRMSADGLYILPSAAVTGGIDGRHRFGPGNNYELNGFLVGSWIHGNEGAIRRIQTNSAHYFQRPDASYLDVDSSLTSLSGGIGNLELKKLGGGHWNWEVGTRARSPGLEINDFGFENYTDRIEEYADGSYNVFQPGKVFRSWSVSVTERGQWTFGGETVQRYGSVEGSFQLLNRWSGAVEVERSQSALSTSELRGGPALVLPGQSIVSAALSGDRRRRAVWNVGAAAYFTDQTGGRAYELSTGVDLRPSSRVLLSIGPVVQWNGDAVQYISQASDSAGARHYYFGSLDQATVALTTRLNYTLTPRLSFQFYGQPFISAGKFSNPVQVLDPRAPRFTDRFAAASLSSLPDFNVKEFRSNAVLRWEYRPGSTLFVVWNSALDQSDPTGTLRLVDDTRRLFRADGTNVLLVKLSYWFGL